MSRQRRDVAEVFTVALAALLFATSAGATVKPKKFTVEDEIGLAHFGDPYTSAAQPFLFSPDRQLVALYIERGVVSANRLEDALRIYRTRDLEIFVSSTRVAEPVPVWTLTLGVTGSGAAITNWQWLADSTAIAFLRRLEDGTNRLALAIVGTRQIEDISASGEHVTGFDIHDRTHMVYAAAMREPAPDAQFQTAGDAVPLTGRSIYDVLASSVSERSTWVAARAHVIAVSGRDRKVVVQDGQPIVVDSQDALSLSPNGRFMAAPALVNEVPGDWEWKYRAPYPTFPYQIRKGAQEANTSRSIPVTQYVLVDLEAGAGSVRAITGAPTSTSAGWFAPERARWSADGESVVLPGTFIAGDRQEVERPCVAVVRIKELVSQCVEKFPLRTESGYEAGYYSILGAEFTDASGQRLALTVHVRSNSATEVRSFMLNGAGAWEAAHKSAAAESSIDALHIEIKQGLTEAPKAVAIYRRKSRVFFDPNPQAEDFDWQGVAVYRWVDDRGRKWRGGLFKPAGKITKPLPLIVQTHGFVESEFRPSGIYPTGFAARALAAAGMLVLQVDESQCLTQTPQEADCAVSGYVAAVRQLIATGLADPGRIGIVGFSRTCYYVMRALTRESLKFQAAIITDGVLQSYSQYLFALDGRNRMIEDSDAVIGARPFGDGLRAWMQQSPEFNLDKVTTPLLVVACGRLGALFMWEPYAALRSLERPVDLLMLNTTEHVLRNPRARLASQGTTVDWFAFWLKDEESVDEEKVEQYARWTRLRSLVQSPVPLSDNHGLAPE